MVSFVRRHVWLSVAILLNLIAVGVVIFAIVMHGAKTATIYIEVAPSGATVELNGQKYENYSTYEVLPGDYHVKVGMEGMQTKEFDVEVKDGEFARIETYLLDENGGFSYYLNNSDEMNNLEKVASDEKARKIVEEYNKKYSLVERLPIEFDDFTSDFTDYINYSIEKDDKQDCEKVLCLKIVDKTGGNEQAAKDKIIEYGYNPNDYGIEYEDDSYGYRNGGYSG